MAEPSELRATISGAVRNLVLILGDQLDANARVLNELNTELDAVLMHGKQAEASCCGANIFFHERRTDCLARKLRVTDPGKCSVLDELNASSEENAVPLDILEDEHVLTRKVRFARTRLVP